MNKTEFRKSDRVITVKTSSTVKKSVTKKQQVRSKIDLLMNNNEFITWDMIGVDPFTHNNKYLSYEGKIVFEYMKELGLDYIKYGDKYSNKIKHRNTKGFYIGIAEKRKRKLQQIESLNF
jgi:hypothetical protein